MTTKALVLGGGGVTGIAWELGVIAGLAAAGCDVRDADLIVGTSAGATVAAQISTGPLDDLVASQRSTTSAEIAAELDLDLMIEIFTVLGDRSIPADERRAAVGAHALAAETVPEAVRREVIAARLPAHRWPDAPVLLTAVDALSGELVTFDRTSGVELVDAVAASCAVPGVWPPVTIGGRRYVDGGVRSSTNADLAAAHDRILVLTPMAQAMALGPRPPGRPAPRGGHHGAGHRRRRGGPRPHRRQRPRPEPPGAGARGGRAPGRRGRRRGPRPLVTPTPARPPARPAEVGVIFGAGAAVITPASAIAPARGSNRVRFSRRWGGRPGRRAGPGRWRPGRRDRPALPSPRPWRSTGRETGPGRRRRRG